MTIEGWRAEIDAIDRKLLHLLNRRAQIVIELAKLKRKRGLPMDDQARERNVILQAQEANRGPFDAAAVARLFRGMIRESRCAAARAIEAAHQHLRGACHEE
jgi:chorismate mutase